MNYSETLTLTLPATLAATAAAVGRAMDPDVGGADSFRHPITGYDETGPMPTPTFDLTTLTTTTACTPAFKAAALTMFADTSGQALHDYCAADYAARWAALTPPSLADCAGFVAALTIVQPPAPTLQTP